MMCILKVIHMFPATEKVVGVITFKDRAIIATEKGVYEIIKDELVYIPLKEEANEKRI